MKDEIIGQINASKVIAIVRGSDNSKCLKVAEALWRGGIKLLEITYNQENPEIWESTAKTIGDICREFSGDLFVGAGTVTNELLVKMTADNGGQFIISPNTNETVIRKTNELNMVSIPGAMTPTEILLAHDCGADFVKLFPASNLGSSYLKAIRAPINHVPILATGGISDANAKEFLDAGAAGLGVGGSLTNKSAIANEEYYILTEAAEKLLNSIKQ